MASTSYTPTTLTPAEAATALHRFHAATGIPPTILTDLLRESKGGNPNWDNFITHWAAYPFTRGTVGLPFACPEDAPNLVKLYLAVAWILFREEIGINQGLQSRARAAKERVQDDCYLRYQNVVGGKERVTWLQAPAAEPKRTTPKKRTTRAARGAEVEEEEEEEEEEVEHEWNKAVGVEISRLRAALEVPADVVCRWEQKKLEVRLAGICQSLVDLRDRNAEFREIEQNGWVGIKEANLGTSGFAEGEEAVEEETEGGDEEGGHGEGQGGEGEA
ncbi:uncharacterized protein BDZ99DRAFT_496685 [Mytilinidion resinicola]|uniref:Uncharacterized protein n=1 Tax=Mytilinidion resinicola TaxID=574789 RepID=A0A6A6YW33_9PEZI|nr:uncharacterized protein BDZ99DRAFT_496685 [Mytilinidion resinicola]KAF2812195.1 hypothetical protein BDZ99DRAFT_496685 [Mytilinidion resinicola]